MRFATLALGDREQAALRLDAGWAPLDLLDPELAGDLMALIATEPDPGRLAALRALAGGLDPARLVAPGAAVFAPPYRHPRKIWGIGLNYGDHAADLHEKTPDQPASFIKGDHTIIGPGEPIVIPRQSSRTTAEAELGLIFGRHARDVPPERALDQLFGVCAILDQTAEDILQLNPRYLTRAKNFPSFFAFGPEVVTLDEFLAGRALADVEVATILDGAEVRRNRIGNMTHGPVELVSFHSWIMPFFPGDIISTGTPGAGILRPGSVATAEVSGLAPLTNPVRAE